MNDMQTRFHYLRPMTLQWCAWHTCGSLEMAHPWMVVWNPSFGPDDIRSTTGPSFQDFSHLRLETGFLKGDSNLLIWGWVNTYYCHIWGNNHLFTSYFRIPRVPGFWPITICWWFCTWDLEWLGSTAPGKDWLKKKRRPNWWRSSHPWLLQVAKVGPPGFVQHFLHSAIVGGYTVPYTPFSPRQPVGGISSSAVVCSLAQFVTFGASLNMPNLSLDFDSAIVLFKIGNGNSWHNSRRGMNKCPHFGDSQHHLKWLWRGYTVTFSQYL